MTGAGRTVVVWGLLGAYPFGGMTWQVLHHLEALRRLGCDVWYVEDSDAQVIDPVTYCPTFEVDRNVAFLRRRLDAIGLGDRWAFRPPGQEEVVLGLDRPALRRLYARADAALNVCGAQELRREHDSIPCKIYLQTDPVADQIAVARGEQHLIDELDQYTALFTYGETQSSAASVVPMERYEWHATRPPVIVDGWACTPASAGEALSTVANWTHSDRDVEWQGETYLWRKDQAFAPYLDLPARSPVPLELAVGAISQEARDDLRARGWRIRDSSSWTTPTRTGPSSAGPSVSSPRRRTSTSGRTAGGSATAAPATSPPAVP